MEIHILDDVIAELEEEGYSLNADAIERMIGDHDRCAAGEFVVGEVFRCCSGSGEIVYLWTVSCEKFHIKCILFNVEEEKRTVTVLDWCVMWWGKMQRLFINKTDEKR